MTAQPERQDVEPRGLEGYVPTLASEAERRAALDQAFDYRGDVTITTTDGRVIEGYIFDRRADVPEPIVRLIPKDAPGKLSVKYSEVAALAFTGRDPAAGRSWETWLKKYAAARAKGEHAGIESEPLE